MDRLPNGALERALPMNQTDLISNLRTRLGRTEKEANAARTLLAEYRAKNFEGVAPENVAAARNIASGRDLEAANIRGQLSGMERRDEATDDGFLSRQATVTELETKAREIRERIEQLEDENERTTRAQRAGAAAGAYRSSGGATTQQRGGTYNPDSRSSWIGDCVAVYARGEMDGDARARLAAHDQEMRAANRTDGTGGTFVPPEWLIDQYVPLARPKRVTADLLQPFPMPPGTDTIQIPKITTGTLTAIQTADNATIASQDIADVAIAAPVRTIAGFVDVALQLLEQSPVNLDKILFADLLADYGQRLDLQVLDGTGASGQVTGLRQTSGINAVSFVSPVTVTAFASKVSDAAQRIATATFGAGASALVLHPRRWAWITAAVDAQGRPLVVPHDLSDGESSFGTVSAGTAEGRVGSFAGLPVFVDANITTNNGAGTNEDYGLVLDVSQVMLFEGGPRLAILPQAVSGNLTMRLRLHNYVAIAVRQPGGISTVSGAGCVPPVF